MCKRSNGEIILKANYKFKCNSPEESTRIQQALFKLGYSWAVGGKIVSYTNQPYLYAYHDGNIGRGYYESGFLDSEDFKTLTIKEIERMAGINTEFTKDELTSGMRVKTRNGRIYVVVKDIGVFVRKDNFMSFGKYNDDLKHCSGWDDEWDIMEIYQGYDNAWFMHLDALGKLIWERKEKSEKDLQLEALQKTIADAQKQIDEIMKGQ